MTKNVLEKQQKQFELKFEQQQKEAEKLREKLREQKMKELASKEEENKRKQKELFDQQNELKRKQLETEKKQKQKEIEIALEKQKIAAQIAKQKAELQKKTNEINKITAERENKSKQKLLQLQKQQNEIEARDAKQRQLNKIEQEKFLEKEKKMTFTKSYLAEFLKYTPDGYNAIIQTIGSETAQYDEKQQQNCKECMIYEQELRKANQTIKLLKSQVFKLQEEQKENELTIIEMEKEIKTLKVRDISNYKQWKHADILLWILSIKDVNGNKIFKKYEDKLSKELANNELTGMDLVSIEKSDIKDLGINVFKDRNLLYQKIKLMIKKNNKKPNMNNDHISNNNMMNEGSNAPTAYM
eukprot:52278_1